jgi:hypothetical protein
MERGVKGQHVLLITAPLLVPLAALGAALEATIDRSPSFSWDRVPC